MPTSPGSARVGRALLALAILVAVATACASDSDDTAPSNSASISTGSTSTNTVSANTVSTNTVTTETTTTTTAVVPTTAAPAPATSIAAITTIAPTTTVGLVPASEPVGSVTHEVLTIDGLVRTYRLYIPSALPDGPVPLFVALHGGTGWGDQFAQTDHIESLAESNGFVVVHPDGVKVQGGPGGAWNAGACCGAPAVDGVDDVTFVSALIDTIEGRFAIDPARVFAVGHSNGAMMSYRLACELSSRIVGIGMWAGALEIDGCAPTQPVSIIQGHGDADLNIPLEGGHGPQALAGVAFTPPHEGFATLAAADGCDVGTTSTVGNITVEERSVCAAGVAAEFITLHTANHSWPGGTPRRAPANGPGYEGWDATAEIVGFLLAHPRTT